MESRTEVVRATWRVAVTMEVDRELVEMMETVAVKVDVLGRVVVEGVAAMVAVRVGRVGAAAMAVSAGVAQEKEEGGVKVRVMEAVERAVEERAVVARALAMAEEAAAARRVVEWTVVVD